ncbi:MULTISPECIES: glycosyltransferase [Calothrix]|nr:MULTISPECIES: glycosyltransferase [Calothrix]
MPEIFKFKGGIQVYSLFFLQALKNIYPNAKYDVFLKNDIQPLPNLSSLNSTQLHCTGFVPLPLRTLIFAIKLIFTGLWKKPSLVIACHINFIVGAYWLKRILGIPYWVITYGIEAWGIQSTHVNQYLHHADRILSISSYTRDRLIKEQNLDPNKVFLLPCQFDPNNFKPTSKPLYLLNRYGLEAKQKVILTVARLSEVEQYKGYDQVLKAMPQIRELIPDVHYIIVGKGNDKSRIEELIIQLKLQDCVTLAGFIPDSELCDYYNLCDIFAMPSKMEGFGIVYLEALACGKPVLGGNQDGSIDALDHGKLGALVNPDDVKEIADSIIQILQGKYPNKLIYQPEYLRQEVINLFGFDRFQETLKKYMEENFKQKLHIYKF